MKAFIESNNIRKNEIAYIGDDINDYNGMKIAYYTGCPRDAADEIRSISQYVSTEVGGNGAVRDIICHLLKNRGQWEAVIRASYHFGL